MEHRIAGPAKLESSDLLQVLAFEKDPGAAPAVEVGRGQDGCAVNEGCDPIVSLGQIGGRGYLHGDLAGGHGGAILATLETFRGGGWADPR